VQIEKALVSGKNIEFEQGQIANCTHAEYKFQTKAKEIKDIKKSVKLKTK
jgi:hypothetical protein